ncbi:GFA family protein [Ottowia sp.]|uniref:GFA family protein n=1 Tax=Ottowia sp. TaxID=1898956 RepID=UPI003A84A19E
MPVNLKEVNGVEIQSKHKASCHCGSIELELSLPDGLVDIRRCDCSLCRRRGAIVASVPLSDIGIVKGHEYLKLYQFNTKTAKHYFCGNCGIYTHHQRRSNSSQYGFNVACLEGINPLKINDVPTYDGVNHPTDRR